MALEAKEQETSSPEFGLPLLGADVAGGRGTLGVSRAPVATRTSSLKEATTMETTATNAAELFASVVECVNFGCCWCCWYKMLLTFGASQTGEGKEGERGLKAVNVLLAAFCWFPLFGRNILLSDIRRTTWETFKNTLSWRNCFNSI